MIKSFILLKQPSSLLFFIAACFAVAHLSPTFAQETTACSDLGEAAFSNYQKLELQGVEAFQAKDYPNAIKHFDTAKALCDRSQSLMFALGRAHQLVGNCSAAIDHYNKALKLDGPKLDNITKRLSEAKDECAKRPGALSVICEQPGVMLSINGAPPVACPLTLSLPTGTVVVSAEKPEFEPAKQDAQIKSGETTNVRIPTLKAVKKDAPPPRPPPPPDNTMDIISWSLMGGGVLLIGGGVGFYAWADNLQSDFQNAADSVDANNVVQNGLSRPDALALESDIDQKNITAWSMIGVGSAALVTGIILWSLPKTETTISVSPNAGAGQLITIQGSF